MTSTERTTPAPASATTTATACLAGFDDGTAVHANSCIREWGHPGNHRTHDALGIAEWTDEDAVAPAITNERLMALLKKIDARADEIWKDIRDLNARIAVLELAADEQDQEEMS